MTKTPTDFEDYLSDKHADKYCGLDDEMGDYFNDWLGDQDVEDLITWGNEFAKMKQIEVLDTLPVGLFDSTPYRDRFIEKLKSQSK